MIRAALTASALTSVTLASAAPAAAPSFETPAPIAYMIDLASGAELLAKNADRRMPPASLAKMMETELTFELIDKGQLSLSKLCTVQPATWRKWHGPAAGSTMFLSPGEQVSVQNLLHGVVTLSGNDAAIVLAECVGGTEQTFVARENELAKGLGIKTSYFGTPNGWPDNDVTMVTARDLAKLARATIERHPKLYKQFYAQPNFTWGKTLASGADITQDNRNPLLGRVAGADGLKTGHTEEAGYGFTGSAEQNGRRLIIVLAGMTSTNQRIEESVRLMNWGFNAWQTKPLYKLGAKVGSAQVQLGSASQVSLVAPRDIAMTMPAGLGGAIKSIRIRYVGPLEAPINKGEHVADLVATTESGPQIMPLDAGESVEEAGFFRRAWIGLEQLLGIA
ncbi:MAG: D-alanyl-D-alanine carboxypeptidase family protein [Sphingomicrobium sp.]